MTTPPPPAELLAVSDTEGIVIPELLTVNSVAGRRTNAGKLVAGTAASSDVELFKGRGTHTHKPRSKRWDCK